jgi:hypothetical protein
VRERTRRKEMRTIAIQLSLLIATIIASPAALPDQERADNPGKIELLPEQLDNVTAGQFLTCGPSGVGTFMCTNTSMMPSMATCIPSPIGGIPTPGGPTITHFCF